MTHILIKHILRPFSHTPGTICLLPGTPYGFQIYPTLIQIYSFAEPRILKTISINIKGPVTDFTVQQDLKKGILSVWGHYQNGFLRYHFRSDVQNKNVRMFVEKAPKGGIRFNDQIISSKESIFLFDSASDFEPYQPPLTPTLSLGVHKTQDWDLINRRLDMKEIIPFWYKLGSLTPSFPLISYEGTLRLLERCQEIQQPEKIGPALSSLYQAGFYSLLTPCLLDHSFQGLVDDPVVSNSDLSPLLLLTEGAKFIQTLFLQQKEQNISILPLLPPEFFAGRFLALPVKYGSIDLEWSKKIIRRMIFHSDEDQSLTFNFKRVKRCRLRKSNKERGETCSIPITFQFEKKSEYLFDNFE